MKSTDDFRKVIRPELAVLAYLLSAMSPSCIAETYTVAPLNDGAVPGATRLPALPPGAVSRIKTADLAVTDIYPGKKPHGQFWMRVTNNGPDTLQNAVANATCYFVKKDKNNGQQHQSPARNFKVPLNLNPGQTKAFATGLTLDTNVFSYFVRCEVRPVGFNDKYPPNDSYHEEIQ